MAMNLHVCRSCSAEFETDDETGPADLACCGPCRQAMVRRFSKPDRLAGVATLGDLMAASHRAHWDSLEEAADPDLKEVFPGLSREARPAGRRSLKIGSELGAALARAGKPVGTVVLTPQYLRTGDPEDDLWFAFAITRPDKPAAFTEGGFGDAHRVTSILGFDNAHDYRADGTPLDPPGESA